MGWAPLPVRWLLTLPLWHVDAVKGGGVHPIAYGAGQGCQSHRSAKLREAPNVD